MDFKKIARIFILTFGLLNIYLIVSIFGRQDIQYTSSEPTTNDNIANMEELDIKLHDLEGIDIKEEEIFPLQINANHLLADEFKKNDKLTGIVNKDKTIYYKSFQSNQNKIE